MLRPRRAASQKRKSNENVNVDLELSEESSGDFSSASSDEYDPTKDKGKIEETFEESDEFESSGEEDEESSFVDSPVKR